MLTVNGFIWDYINTNHIVKHDLLPEEVDETLGNPWVLTRTRNHSYFAFYGVTHTGRYIIAILTQEDNYFWRPKTVYDMGREDIEYYKKEVSS